MGIVLTDTGPYRGGMTECYHGPCDIYNPNNDKQINWKFFLHTTQTLIDTVIDLTEATCNMPKNSHKVNLEYKDSRTDLNQKYGTKEMISSEANANHENKTSKESQKSNTMKHRQNNKQLFTSKQGRLDDSTLLAYTGEVDISREIKIATYSENNKIIKYRFDQNTVPEISQTKRDNLSLFYPATNVDNSFFTWINLPRSSYKKMSNHCYPMCHIKNIITGRLYQ